MIEQTVEELTPVIGTRPACRALGAAPATIYRRRRPPAPRPALAKALIAQATAQQQIQPHTLTVHADRGSSTTSKPVAFFLADLGVLKSHSRPYTSTENPYSEAHFKTLKYRPDFPDRFQNIEQARAFGRSFFDWYNHQHRHSGIGLMTPATVHHGHAQALHAERARVPPAGLRAHPRAIRPPATHAARPPDRRLDQQAQRRRGRSLNPDANRLIRLDRLRSRPDRSCQAIAKAETVRGNAARLGRSVHAVPRQDAGTGRAGGAGTTPPRGLPLRNGQLDECFHVEKL